VKPDRNPFLSQERSCIAPTDRAGWRCAGLLTLVCLWGVPGCLQQHENGLVMKSQSWPGRSLAGRFESSYYSLDGRNNLTLVLIDGPPDDPAQAVTIRMFWKPRAGRTPIDLTATNATIHYTIFSSSHHGEAGVYSGAGFVYPVDRVGGEVLRADVWQATLRLTDRSAGFEDLLGEVMLEGHLTATRDEAAVHRVLRRIQILITEKMGYPKHVDASGRECVSG